MFPASRSVGMVSVRVRRTGLDRISPGHCSASRPADDGIVGIVAVTMGSVYGSIDLCCTDVHPSNAPLAASGNLNRRRKQLVRANLDRL